jgi:hypothetical protein
MLLLPSFPLFIAFIFLGFPRQVVMQLPLASLGLVLDLLLQLSAILLLSCLVMVALCIQKQPLLRL